MSAIFADSVYFIALLNRTDQYHVLAKEATASITRPLVTTNWVFVEVADALGLPGYRNDVHHFLLGMAADPNVRIVSADSAWYDRGLALYGARPDKSWSLTDCISFELFLDISRRPEDLILPRYICIIM